MHIANVLVLGKNDQAGEPETFFNFVWANIIVKEILGELN